MLIMNSKSTHLLLIRLVAGEIEQYIASNKTETEIEKSLIGLCDKIFSGTIEDLCDGLVSNYTALLVSILEQEESPDTACVQLKLCQVLYLS